MPQPTEADERSQVRSVGMAAFSSVPRAQENARFRKTNVYARRSRAPLPDIRLTGDEATPGDRNWPTVMGNRHTLAGARFNGGISKVSAMSPGFARCDCSAMGCRDDSPPETVKWLVDLVGALTRDLTSGGCRI